MALDEGVLGLDAGGPVPALYRQGTHRIEAPEVTLARLLPRLEEFGVTRVSRITGFDRTGVEVVTAVRPNARALSVANGKGASLAAAKVSGIMEAAERWHGERPALPLRFGAAEDLAAPVWVAGLPRVRAGGAGPMIWAPARDLAGGGAGFVPFDLVHTAWLAGLPVSEFWTSTNGLASGSHPVEAALHGLCELVEHDGRGLFERLGAEAKAARRVDLASVADAEAAGLLERLEAAGFGVALWDATSDVGLPTFLAALTDRRAPRTPPGFGAGCHPSRGVATLRALNEAAQTRAIAITGTRDDLTGDLFAAHIGMRFRWAVEEAGGFRPWGRTADLATGDLRVDLAGVVAALARAGCGPALAVDLSRDARLSVLRMLVPGLEAGGPGDGALPGWRAAAAERLMA